MAAPVQVKPKYWERNYDAAKIASKIERTSKEIQDTRIHQTSQPVFNVLRGLILVGLALATVVGFTVAIKFAATALSTLAVYVSMAAFAGFVMIGVKWIIESPITTAPLEAKLDRLFNKMFVADKGKLTDDHLKLLQKHAVEIRNPEKNHYLTDFRIGVETKHAIMHLKRPLSTVETVVQETLQDLIKTKYISIAVFNQMRHWIDLTINNILEKPDTKETQLNKLKEHLKSSLSKWNILNEFAVDEQDAALVLKGMTNRQTFKLMFADTDEIFKAMQDLPLTELELFGADYTTERASLVPKTLKKLYWSSHNKVEDVKPLADRCPDLEELEKLEVKPDDLKLFKNLKKSA